MIGAIFVKVYVIHMRVQLSIKIGGSVHIKP